MTRTSLDDAQWTSLWLAIQQIPHAWKRDEAALRRFLEAVLWILRTGVTCRNPWDTGRACITAGGAGVCVAGVTGYSRIFALPSRPRGWAGRQHDL